MTNDKTELVRTWIIKGMGVVLFLCGIYLVVADQVYSKSDIYHFNLEWYYVAGLVVGGITLVLFPVHKLRMFGSKYINKKIDDIK